MNTNIIVNLQIEGVHRWPDAEKLFPQVNYLSEFHRHMFWITCKKKVTHSDRDVEFIMYKKEIFDWFDIYYNDGWQLYNFDTLSCEMIAKKLVEYFALEYCSVMEDNENGAEVYKEIGLEKS